MEVYSFDVFDTCLTRIYVHPTDLFYDVAPIFLKQFCQYGFDENSIRFFVYARKRAEKEIRYLNSNKKEDINLISIYQQLKTILPWHFNLEEAMQIEMLCEQKSLAPVFLVKKLIDNLRKKQNRIIFISDMYLPSAFIKKCLVEHKIASKEDAVYVSGDIGLTKHQGSLFHHVLTSEKIKPSQLIHCGDSLYADVTVPRKLGIQAQHFSSIQLTKYESSHLKDNYEQVVEKISLSKLYAYGRLERISNLIDIQEKNPNDELVCGVIAPLLTAFVVWVLRTAINDGVQRLYFVSRDGQILFKIAQELKKYIKAPECSYLYGSRHAWLLPSIINCNDDSLAWLTLPGRSTSIKSILARLNLEVKDVEALLNTEGYHNNHYSKELTGNDLEQFKNFLTNSLKMRSVIEKKALVARELLSKYLNQEKFNDGTTWAIVDIGWRLNCQGALKRVVEWMNCPCEVKGYYFALADDYFDKSIVGEYKSFIKGQSYFSRRGLLVEHVFTPADHPTVVGYTKAAKGVVPLFKNVKKVPEIIDYTKRLHKICCNYARDTACAGLWDQSFDTIDNKLQKIAIRLLKCPTKIEAHTIGWIPVVLDQLHIQSNSQSLAEKISLVNLFKLIQFELGIRKTLTKSPYWLEGSAIQSSFVVKNILLVTLTIKQAIQKFIN